MVEGGKRKAETQNGQAKRVKYSKFKSTNRGKDNALSNLRTIEPGSSGIWATCVRGLEGKATAQMREVLEEYAQKLYPELFAGTSKAGEKGSSAKDEQGEEDEDEDVDIEAAVRAELAEAKSTSQKHSFTTIRIDIACVLYFKVDPPMDAVHLVHRICEDAAACLATKRTRHINRVTPISLIGKATLDSIGKTAEQVLRPHFPLNEDAQAKSFAIRPTIRNHKVLKRQEIIEKVAKLVGDKHRVDLSNPDLVILVDVYTNTAGISVVDGSYEKNLKRYNLNELYGGKPEGGKGDNEKAAADKAVKNHSENGVTAEDSSATSVNDVDPVASGDAAVASVQGP